MGIDISHIIKHDFLDIDNHDEAMRFVTQTMSHLSKTLHIPFESEDKWDLRYDKDIAEISFRLPIYEVEFFLHKGFWQIESYYHYCHIVMHHGTYFWLRALTFDLAMALGQKEAWYAEEYYTWNGVLDAPGISFDEWIEECKKSYGNEIPDFVRDEIMAQGNDPIPRYESIYHDSFKECFDELQQLRQVVGNRGKILGLYRISRFIRCEVDGGINLFDLTHNCFVFESPVEDILCPFNGPEFLVLKGNKSALFNAEGKQMSYFVLGQWKWTWSNGHTAKRRLFNEEAELEFFV